MDRTAELWNLLERYEDESRKAGAQAGAPGDSQDLGELKEEFGILADDVGVIRSDLATLRGEIASLRDEVMVLLRGMMRTQEEARRAEALREEQTQERIKEQIADVLRPMAGVTQLHQEILSGVNVTRNKLMELTEEVFELRDTMSQPFSGIDLEKMEALSGGQSGGTSGGADGSQRVLNEEALLSRLDEVMGRLGRVADLADTLERLEDVVERINGLPSIPSLPNINSGLEDAAHPVAQPTVEVPAEVPADGPGARPTSRRKTKKKTDE